MDSDAAGAIWAGCQRWNWMPKMEQSDGIKIHLWHPILLRGWIRCLIQRRVAPHSDQPREAPHSSPGGASFSPGRRRIRRRVAPNLVPDGAAFGTGSWRRYHRTITQERERERTETHLDLGQMNIVLKCTIRLVLKVQKRQDVHPGTGHGIVPTLPTGRCHRWSASTICILCRNHLCHQTTWLSQK